MIGSKRRRTEATDVSQPGRVEGDGIRLAFYNPERRSRFAGQVEVEETRNFLKRSG